MGWRELLSNPQGTEFISPWIGGRLLLSESRKWNIEGRLPRDPGWYVFRTDGSRRAWVHQQTEAQPEKLIHVSKGYLVGNRLLGDHVQFLPTTEVIARASEEVHLLEADLPRFARIAAGRVYPSGPLIYKHLEMPLGPETEVQHRFLRREGLDGIKDVLPSLEAAFRVECLTRLIADQRRVELEEERRREEERIRLEEERTRILRQLGDGAGRRAAAVMDFASAAKAALAVGGAEYLEDRAIRTGHERAVRFKFHDRLFECTCDPRTLRVIEAGICLTSHDTGERGDDHLTLESLPSVIGEAMDEDLLVVLRHVY